MFKTNEQVGLLQHSKQVYETVRFIKGDSISSLKSRIAFEENLEKIVSRAFLHDTIKSILNSTGLEIKRIAYQKISKALMDILRTKRADKVELIYLYPLTVQLFRAIEDFPTVKAVCGDKDNKAQYSLKEESRKMFLDALALFVGRQVLICKHLMGTMISKDVDIATNRFLHRYNVTRSLYMAIHQAANKFIAGKISVDELKEIISSIAEQDYENIRNFIKTNIAPNIDGYFENIVREIEHARDNYIDESIDSLIGNRIVHIQEYVAH